MAVYVSRSKELTVLLPGGRECQFTHHVYQSKDQAEDDMLKMHFKYASRFIDQNDPNFRQVFKDVSNTTIQRLVRELEGQKNAELVNVRSENQNLRAEIEKLKAEVPIETIPPGTKFGKIDTIPSVSSGTKPVPIPVTLVSEPPKPRLTVKKQKNADPDAPKRPRGRPTTKG